MLALRRVAEGDYETPDGRFRVYRLRDVSPPAWNAEDVEFDVYDAEPGAGYDGLIADGYSTKRGAVAALEAHIEEEQK